MLILWLPEVASNHPPQAGANPRVQLSQNEHLRKNRGGGWGPSWRINIKNVGGNAWEGMSNRVLTLSSRPGGIHPLGVVVESLHFVNAHAEGPAQKLRDAQSEGE